MGGKHNIIIGISIIFLFLFISTLSTNAQGQSPEVYNYSAKVVKVYDGDSIWCDIDLGFGIKMEYVKFRLYGINTPEVTKTSTDNEKATGKILANHLRETILGEVVVVNTIKDSRSKYGEYLAIIWVNGININEYMLNNDLCHHYLGGTKVPFTQEELEKIYYFKWDYNILTKY